MSGYGTSTSGVGGLTVAAVVLTMERTLYHQVCPCSAFVSRKPGWSIPIGCRTSHATLFETRRSTTYSTPGTTSHDSAMPSARGSATRHVGVAGTGCGCQVKKFERAEDVPSFRRDRTAYQSVGGEVPGETPGSFSR